MLHYGQNRQLLPSYTYYPEIQEKQRALDLLVASLLDYEITYTWDHVDNYLRADYLDPKDNKRKEVKYYTTNTDHAMSLFEHCGRIRMTFDNIFPADRSSPYAPLGEWKVGYEYMGIIYLPGSGSYYPLAEAITRAWLAMQSERVSLSRFPNE